MKLAYSWIQEHAPLKATAAQVADDLVRLGHEVEAVETPRDAIKGVRVGLIASMEVHPNADKLKLLKLDLAEAEPLAIVCGASNMKAGDKVAVATIGTRLPGGLKIKKGKIRGEVSFGMCCSEVELGLAEDADGLLILPQDAPVGMEVGEYLQLEEAVFDLSITPNRGDCMSARGLGRDLAADAGLPFIEPADEDMSLDEMVAVPVVDCSASVDCPVYLARRLQGVTVGEAPDWMKQRLLAAGQRSVNGVVDVLNYVMLDLGQPMHAFDADCLQGGLLVRSAQEDESFVALDDRELSLHAGDLVIADDEKVIALAGIMGSLATGVTQSTTNIVLESAYFRPARISTTRRVYGMVSEASMRFERAIDPAMVMVAMNQATRMIMELFGGRAGAMHCEGDVDGLMQKRALSCNIHRLESRLGVSIPQSLDVILERMGFEIVRQDDQLKVSVPTHRPDVSMAEDMSEEYARVIGLDAIPAILPALPTIQPMKKDDAIHVAVQSGFTQVITYAFISEREQRLFLAEEEADVVLDNPISDAMAVMRRTIFPGLLNVAKRNLNRQQPGVALVEQGRTYARHAQGYVEKDTLAWLMAGEVEQDRWYAHARRADFFDLKGAVEHWLASRGLTARFIADDTLMGLQAGQSAKIFVGKSVLGSIGKVDADIASSFDVDIPVFVASLDLDALPQAKKTKFVSLAEFPSVQRDLVFLFERHVQSDAVLQAVRKPAGAWLTDVTIFDRYDGQGVPEGKVSLGVRLTLQHPERTLKQDESEQLVQRVIEAMGERFGALLRG